MSLLFILVEFKSSFQSFTFLVIRGPYLGASTIKVEYMDHTQVFQVFFMNVQINWKFNGIFFAGKTNLPPPDIFGKSLYTFYIGQNDFTGNLASIGIRRVKQYLPRVISQIVSTIKVIVNLISTKSELHTLLEHYGS